MEQNGKSDGVDLAFYKRVNISNDKRLTVEGILQAELRIVKQVQARYDNCKEAFFCGS